jgi:cytochrome c556
MKKYLAAAGLAVLIASPVVADETNPNIVHRQGIYKIAAGHMTAMKSIIALGFEQAADHLSWHATGLKDAFAHHKDAYPPGTDKGETKAKPEIWTKNDEFKAAGKKAMEAVDKLVAATQGTDKAAIAGAFKDVGAACKACHEDFKKD